MYQSLNSTWRRINEGAARALAGVSKHHHSRLFGLWARARITKISFVEFGTLSMLILPPRRLVEKILHERGAMMLFDEVDDSLRQSMLPREFYSIFYMGDNDQRTHLRIKRFVLIPFRLVLDKVLGFAHLTDVVKVSAYPTKKRVRANFFCGRLRKRRNIERMIVRPGGPQD